MVQASETEDNHLLKQLDGILNLQLDDYEASLSAIYKKKRLLTEMATAADKRIMVEQDYLRDVGDLEQNYRKKVKEVHEERLELIGHMDILQATLARIEHDVTYPSVKRADDHILRRYAALMSTSHDGGKTFWEVKDIAVCPKCSERTVMCPHRPHHKQVVALPQNTTHIKFDQPHFTSAKAAAESNFSRKKHQSREASNKPVDEVEQSDTLDRPDLNINVPRRYRILYRTFFRRWAGLKPREVRTLSNDRIHEWIEETYEARWNFEESHEINGRVHTLIELPFLVSSFFLCVIKRS